MKSFLFLCFGALHLISCNAFRPSATAVLSTSEKRIVAIKGLRYKAELIKIYSNSDTMALQANVEFLKDSTLKHLGFKVKLTYPEKGELRFNDDTIYAVDLANKKLWISEVAKTGTGSITGNINRSVIGEIFTEKDPYKVSFGGDSRLLKLVGKEKINYQKCWVIESTEQTSEQELIIQYFISKQSYLPVKIQTKFRYQDQVSYSDWKITDVNTKQGLNENDFSKPVLPQDFAVEIVQPPKIEIPRLLENQLPAPDFNLLTLYQDTIALSKLKGRVVVLDFWYMSCPPCLKALPLLQQLYEQYEAEGLIVLGINSKDNNENDLKRLPGFLNYRKLTYPVLLGSEILDAAYAVNAYPSLYLIDASGKIAYSQIGFSEEEMIKLEKEVERLLTDKQ